MLLLQLHVVSQQLRRVAAATVAPDVLARRLAPRLRVAVLRGGPLAPANRPRAHSHSGAAMAYGCHPFGEPPLQLYANTWNVAADAPGQRHGSHGLRPELLRESEKDAKLAQKLGQVQPFSCIPSGMHGPTCIFWANLTPFSLQRGDFAAAARGSLARAGETLCPAGLCLKHGAAAWLNGHKLGEMRSQFRRYSFSVGHLLQEANSLAVVFNNSMNVHGRFFGSAGGQAYTRTLEHSPVNASGRCAGGDGGCGGHTFARGIVKSVYLAGRIRRRGNFVIIPPILFI